MDSTTSETLHLLSMPLPTLQDAGTRPFMCALSIGSVTHLQEDQKHKARKLLRRLDYEPCDGEAARRVDKYLEKFESIRLGSGKAAKAAIAEFCKRETWEAVETIVPSGRSSELERPNLPDILHPETPDPVTLMNDIFWRLSGVLGNELGHETIAPSSGSALTDGQLALTNASANPTPSTRSMLPAGNRSRSPRRGYRRGTKLKRADARSARSPVRDRREDSRSPDSRSSDSRSPARPIDNLSHLRRYMLQAISDEADACKRNRKGRIQDMYVRDISTSREPGHISSRHILDGLWNGTMQLSAIQPVVVVRFKKTEENIAVIGNAELKAAKKFQQKKRREIQIPCRVFEDADYYGAEMPAPLACRLVLQSEDPMRCLTRFLDEKRHAAYDPAENGNALRDYSDNVQNVDVRNIRHSHDFVHMTFQHGPHKGQSVQTLVEDLKSGRCRTSQITPLVLVKFTSDEYWAVFGNRRLKALMLG